MQTVGVFQIKPNQKKKTHCSLEKVYIVSETISEKEFRMRAKHGNKNKMFITKQ